MNNKQLSPETAATIDRYAAIATGLTIILGIMLVFGSACGLLYIIFQFVLSLL